MCESGSIFFFICIFCLYVTADKSIPLTVDLTAEGSCNIPSVQVALNDNVTMHLSKTNNLNISFVQCNLSGQSLWISKDEFIENAMKPFTVKSQYNGTWKCIFNSADNGNGFEPQCNMNIILKHPIDSGIQDRKVYVYCSIGGIVLFTLIIIQTGALLHYRKKSKQNKFHSHLSQRIKVTEHNEENRYSRPPTKNETFKDVVGETNIYEDLEITPPAEIIRSFNQRQRQISSTSNNVINTFPRRNDKNEQSTSNVPRKKITDNSTSNDSFNREIPDSMAFNSLPRRVCDPLPETPEEETAVRSRKHLPAGAIAVIPVINQLNDVLKKKSPVTEAHGRLELASPGNLMKPAPPPKPNTKRLK